MANGITAEGTRIQPVAFGAPDAGTRVEAVALYDWASGVQSALGWGEPIAIWDFSAPVANVDFAGLAAYRELHLWGHDLTSSTATTDFLGLRLSTDNGASYPVTGYVSSGATATSLLALSGTVGPTQPITSSFDLLDFNVGARVTKLSGQSAVQGVAATYVRGGYRPAELNNALRLVWNGGSNFSAGVLRLYGKR